MAAIFKRFKKKQQQDDTWLHEEMEYITEQFEEPNFRIQVTGMIVFMTTILILRIFSGSRLKALSGEHVLNMSALNDANLFKEVFMAYLNAAMLEPVLSIAAMDDETTKEAVLIHLLTLGSICWWISLISDAFSFDDVMQFYKYHVVISEEKKDDPKRYGWFRLKEMGKDAVVERASLVGMVKKDVALWFSLSCIGAAWLPGDNAVSHRDVLHAYVVVLLWTMMHHYCRRATYWGAGYLTSYLFPSTALMPLEYCLPLMDVADTVEDLAFLESYRNFVIERTGVELIIES